MASTKGIFGIRAEVGSSIAPNSVVMIDAIVLAPADGPHALDCGRQSDPSGGTSRFIVLAGAGAYHVDGVADETLGVDAGVKWTIADWAHLGLIASAQAIRLPNASHQRVWVVPITIGLRRQ